MDSKKYIGMDVHQATISIAVADSTGKVVIDSVIETKAATSFNLEPCGNGINSMKIVHSTAMVARYIVLSYQGM